MRNSSEPKPAFGIEFLRPAVGQVLKGLKRYVVGLGSVNDEWGHGMTEIHFETTVLTIKPGPDEDYIVIEEGAVRDEDVNPEYDTLVNFSRREDWCSHIGRKVSCVDCFTDGYEDVALVFHLVPEEQFSIVLCDTSLWLAEGLQLFEHDRLGVVPRFRQRIE